MKINKILCLIFFVIGIYIIPTVCYAESKVFIENNESIIEKEQIFDIKVMAEDINVSAIFIRLFFDGNKVEYVKENNSSNYGNNQILYTWFDEKGGKNPLKSGEITSFRFKTKELGQAEFGIDGTCYNSNGDELDINFLGTTMYIEEKSQELENNVSDDNSYLKILRINKEGIEPYFNKDIFEYYITVGNEVNNFEITAIPESVNSTVNIIGNNSFKEGINKVSIEVISKNNENKKIYNIYVTKTSDIKKANANLENLALENTILYPEFNNTNTNYKAEITNDVETLKLLAIPESANAEVQIVGNEHLKVGYNKVIITVTAENGYTQKKYNIDVYRRNQEEEQKYQEEEAVQTEKLSVVLADIEERENSNDETSNKENKVQESRKANFPWIYILALCVTLIIGIMTIRKST